MWPTYSVWRSAIAMTYAPEHYRGSVMVGIGLSRSYGDEIHRTEAQWLRVGRQARAVADAAAAMYDDPDRKWGSTRLPIDPSIREGESRFRYRVVIEATGTESGARFSYAIDVNSDTPLSWSETDAIAREMFGRELPRRSYEQAIQSLGESIALRITPLTAGKAY